MQSTLRRSGGSLMMTLPKAFTDQNHLQDSSKVELIVDGERLTIYATHKPKYDLKILLAEMPKVLPRVPGW
jgi:antitoxin ChpS